MSQSRRYPSTNLITRISRGVKKTSTTFVEMKVVPQITAQSSAAACPESLVLFTVFRFAAVHLTHGEEGYRHEDGGIDEEAGITEEVDACT